MHKTEKKICNPWRMRRKRRLQKHVDRSRGTYTYIHRYFYFYSYSTCTFIYICLHRYLHSQPAEESKKLSLKSSIRLCSSCTGNTSAVFEVERSWPLMRQSSPIALDTHLCCQLPSSWHTRAAGGRGSSVDKNNTWNSFISPHCHLLVLCSHGLLGPLNYIPTIRALKLQLSWLHSLKQ